MFDMVGVQNFLWWEEGLFSPQRCRLGLRASCRTLGTRSTMVLTPLEPFSNRPHSRNMTEDSL